jgi:hypothetical protein
MTPQLPDNIAPITQVNGTNELMTQIHDARLRLHRTGQVCLMTRRTTVSDYGTGLVGPTFGPTGVFGLFELCL